MSPVSYILAFAIAVIIALLTVIYRSYMASLTNPAQALKYE
jgi:ABC-type lipoprotein release transport system permease subunit